MITSSQANAVFSVDVKIILLIWNFWFPYQFENINAKTGVLFMWNDPINNNRWLGTYYLPVKIYVMRKHSSIINMNKFAITSRYMLFSVSITSYLSRLRIIFKYIYIFFLENCILFYSFKLHSSIVDLKLHCMNIVVTIIYTNRIHPDCPIHRLNNRINKTRAEWCSVRRLDTYLSRSTINS